MAKANAGGNRVSKPNDKWKYKNQFTLNGEKIVEGTLLKVDGIPGKFKFLNHVKTPTAEWIDVWGGTKGSEAMRSFRAERLSLLSASEAEIIDEEVSEDTDEFFEV